jgi:hypothetical protein
MRILVENLLYDVSKIRTISGLKEKIASLLNVFEDYKYEKLLDIFKELKNI